MEDSPSLGDSSNAQKGAGETSMLTKPKGLPSSEILKAVWVGQVMVRPPHIGIEELFRQTGAEVHQALNYRNFPEEKCRHGKRNLALLDPLVSADATKGFEELKRMRLGRACAWSSGTILGDLAICKYLTVPTVAHGADCTAGGSQHLALVMHVNGSKTTRFQPYHKAWEPGKMRILVEF
ncbi:MAG: hypothetical protein ACHQHP_04420 [Bacteroidia bacterium]